MSSRSHLMFFMVLAVSVLASCSSSSTTTTATSANEFEVGDAPAATTQPPTETVATSNAGDPLAPDGGMSGWRQCTTSSWVPMAWSTERPRQVSRILMGDRAWVILDLDGLPIGEGLEAEFPGRLIGQIEIGSDGVLWVSGSAHSTGDDGDFGGKPDAWTGGRYLEFIASGECTGSDCRWTVHTSDEVPGLEGIGDLAVDSSGILYASGGYEPTLFVFDGVEWQLHSV